MIYALITIPATKKYPQRVTAIFEDELRTVLTFKYSSDIVTRLKDSSEKGTLFVNESQPASTLKSNGTVESLQDIIDDLEKHAIRPRRHLVKKP